MNYFICFLVILQAEFGGHFCLKFGPLAQFLSCSGSIYPAGATERSQMEESQNKNMLLKHITNILSMERLVCNLPVLKNVKGPMSCIINVFFNTHACS